MEDYILEEEEECIVLVKPPSPSVLISLRGSSNSERGVQNSTCANIGLHQEMEDESLYTNPGSKSAKQLCYVAIAF